MCLEKGNGAILPPIGLGLSWSHSPQYTTEVTFLSPCGAGQPGGRWQGWEQKGGCLLGQG